MTQTLSTTYEPSEFRNLISECVSETVKKEIAKLITPPEPQKQILTRQETADFLAISLPTLHDYTTRGIIQGHRLGGTVRYKIEDIQKSLLQIKTK